MLHITLSNLCFTFSTTICLSLFIIQFPCFIQEKYHLAEPLYIECLATKKEMFGTKSNTTLKSINNLAALHFNQGKNVIN